MYNFLQPKILAALEQKHGYNPYNKGPCMSSSDLPSWLNHTTKGGEFTTCPAAYDAFRSDLASDSNDPGKFA